MKVRTLVQLGILLAVMAFAGVAAWVSQDLWQPWLEGLLQKKEETKKEGEHSHSRDRVKISRQGAKNLGLKVAEAPVETLWRHLDVPGTVIDQPGRSDRTVPAPVTGVVETVAYPGAMVRPGESLFKLRVLSEALQTTQAELFKTAKDLKLIEEKIKPIQKAVDTGAIAESELVELKQQRERLIALMKSHTQELVSKGLTKDHLDDVRAGKYVKEVTVVVPKPGPGAPLLSKGAGPIPADHQDLTYAFQVQDLKVQPGEQVQAGQALAVLGNHRELFVEGHAFRKEAPLIEKAIENAWPVELEVIGDDPEAWPSLGQKLLISHIGTEDDPISRTLAFFVPLVNQARTHVKDGKTTLVWRFRKNQQVRLRVPLEEIKDLIVLPVEAVVREGAEAYVFVPNGEAFDRKAVNVVYEDRTKVGIADDGSLVPGLLVVHNRAAALNRVLKAQQSEGEGGGHHGHSH